MYHNGCDAILKQRDIFAFDVFDLDDLKRIGKSGQGKLGLRPFCPFYASREAQRRCSIILLPYTYLVTPSMRDRLDINYTNDVIIVDEAHNLESTAEDAVSFELNLQDLEAVQLACDNCLSILEANEPGNESDVGGGGGGKIDRLSLTDCSILKEQVMPLILNMTDWMNRIQLRSSTENMTYTCLSLKQLHSDLTAAGMTDEFYHTYHSILTRLHTTLESVALTGDGGNDAESHLYSHWASRVEHFCSCITVITASKIND